MGASRRLRIPGPFGPDQDQDQDPCPILITAHTVEPIFIKF